MCGVHPVLWNTAMRIWGKGLVFQHKPSWKYAYVYKSCYSQLFNKKLVVEEEDNHYEHQEKSFS